MSQDSEQSLIGNDDPQEVVGPQGSIAPMNAVSVGKDQILNDNEDLNFRVKDSIDEQFVAEVIPVGISPVDGLPLPADSILSLPIAAPFTREALVCMEDDRQFVEMFQDEAHESDGWVGNDPPPGVFLCLRRKFDEEGSPVARRVFSASDINGKRFGIKTVEERDEDVGVRVTFVRPIRPQCKHYARTVFCNDPSIPYGELGHMEMQRNCMARRSVGGAFMSLSGEGVYACELREPRHDASELQHIVVKDRERLNAKIEEVPLFNLQAK